MHVRRVRVCHVVVAEAVSRITAAGASSGAMRRNGETLENPVIHVNEMNVLLHQNVAREHAIVEPVPQPALGGPIVPGVNGVFASADHGTVVCGENAAVWWVEADGTWTADVRAPATTRAFHACTIDETGAVWAVGGDLTTLTEGVLVRSEPGVPAVDP